MIHVPGWVAKTIIGSEMPIRPIIYAINRYITTGRLKARFWFFFSLLPFTVRKDSTPAHEKVGGPALDVCSVRTTAKYDIGLKA
jgi:hypothetical protein